jgi:hypothetical protein
MPAAAVGSTLLTIVAAAVALLIVLFLLKVFIKLAWHLVTIGCFVILLLAAGAALATYLMR